MNQTETAVVRNEVVRNEGKARAKARPDFAQFRNLSTDHAAWADHREAMLRVPSNQVFRGCLGIAVSVHGEITEAAGWHQFVKTDDLRFHVLTDVDRGRFDLRHPREVWWAATYRPEMKHGMPVVGERVEMQADFRRFPESGQRDALDPGRYPQEFRIFNALNVAMTTTACRFRKSWTAVADEVTGALRTERGAVVCGERIEYGRMEPLDYLPRAYGKVRYANMLADLFDEACTIKGPGGTKDVRVPFPGQLRFVQAIANGDRMYNPGGPGHVRQIVERKDHGVDLVDIQLQHDDGTTSSVRTVRAPGVRFDLRVGTHSKVKVGELLAVNDFGPTGLERLSLPEQWEWSMRQLTKSCAPRYHREWLARQLVRVAGELYMPLDLVSIAAATMIEPDSLIWDIRPCVDYMDDTSDSMILPPLPHLDRDSFNIALPGEIYANLVPNDERFRAKPGKEVRVRVFRK